MDFEGMGDGVIHEPPQLMFIDAVRVTAGMYGVSEEGDEELHQEPGLFVAVKGTQVIGSMQDGYARIPSEFEMVIQPEHIETVIASLIHGAMHLASKMGKHDL